MPLPGRTVKATGWGTGALTIQHSVGSFRLGEGVDFSLQQLCCCGMGAAIQATTGAMTRTISTALTARQCVDLIMRDNNTTKFRPLVCDRRHKYRSHFGPPNTYSRHSYIPTVQAPAVCRVCWRELIRSGDPEGNPWGFVEIQHCCGMSRLKSGT